LNRARLKKPITTSIHSHSSVSPLAIERPLRTPLMPSIARPAAMRLHGKNAPANVRA
jgi:hypothetical protein